MSTPSNAIDITARNGETIHKFKSMTDCAEFFAKLLPIPRGAIQKRLTTREKYILDWEIEYADLSRVCAVCGKNFIASYAAELTCSYECREKLIEIRRHEKKAEAQRYWLKRAREKRDIALEVSKKKKSKQITLEEKAKQATDCGLSYGAYVYQLSQGKTYEELRAEYEERRANIVHEKFLWSEYLEPHEIDEYRGSKGAGVSC